MIKVRIKMNVRMLIIIITIVVVVIYKGRNMPESIYSLKMARARIQT